MSEKPIDKNL